MIITRRKLIRSAALAAPALILPSPKLLARPMHGSGGGGGYVAWRFQSGSALVAPLSNTDSPLMLASCFGLSHLDLSTSTNLFAVWQSDNGPTILVNGTRAGFLYLGLSNADGSASGQWRSSSAVFTDSNRHHILIGADISAVDYHDWVVVAYVDDVLVPIALDTDVPAGLEGIFPNGVIQTGSGPMNISFDANNMNIPDFINYTFDQDLQNIVIYTGQSGIVGGAILSGTRRLFSDPSSNPVDTASMVSTLGTPMLLLKDDDLLTGHNSGSGGNLVQGGPAPTEVSWS